MKAKALLPVMLLALLSPVTSAFSQPAALDPNRLAKFQSALKQGGFDVTPGEVDIWNRAAEWCAHEPGVDNAWYSNNEPYLQFLVPEIRGGPGSRHCLPVAGG